MAVAVKTLAPQELRAADFKPLEAEINRYAWEHIFGTVVARLKKLLHRDARGSLPELHNELRNAADTPLRQALQSGRAQLVVSKGTASITIAGGAPGKALAAALRDADFRFNKTTKRYTAPAEAVPAWIRQEAEAYTAAAKQAHEDIRALLDDIKRKVQAGKAAADLDKGRDHAVDAVEEGWKRSAKALEASWALGPEGVKTLDAEFAKKDAIPLKDEFDKKTGEVLKHWALDEIKQMRAEVDENAAQGYRAEGLAERIHERYTCSQSRANLIARQETNNFMAAYRKARAVQAGCKKYIWTCAGDARVRPLHKKLNGQIFEYDKPPIIDERTGSRGNPGMIWRCRCVDIPVLEAA